MKGRAEVTRDVFTSALGGGTHARDNSLEAIRHSVKEAVDCYVDLWPCPHAMVASRAGALLAPASLRDDVQMLAAEFDNELRGRL